MEHWLGFVPYVLFVGGGLSLLFAAHERRTQARRRRLTTVTARFGLFLNWIATAVALILGGLGVVVFYTWTTNAVWLLSGGLCAAGLVVWLLGRGIFFVLAGSPPEEPQPSQAPSPEDHEDPQEQGCRS
jgi:hypothetical protein